MTINPEQFNKLATKDDVEEIVEDKMNKFKDEVLTGQDRLTKKLDTILTEQVAFTGGQKRQDKKFEEHDKRLEQVEVKIGIEPITTYDGDG